MSHIFSLARSYETIFSISDHVSRLYCFIPSYSSMFAFECASMFWEHWVCRFGMLKKVVCDRDGKITNAFWSELRRFMYFKVALWTVYQN